MLQQTAVLALIDKETGLLPLEPIDMEAEPVLQGLVGLHVADDVVVYRVEVSLVGQGGLALVIHVAHDAVRQLGQGLGNHVAGKVHAGRMGLHDGGGAVDIDHQSWQEISLAMHEAKGVVVLALQPQGLAHAVSVLQAFGVEGLIDGRVVKCEHSHCNAADLAVAVADERSVVGIYRYQVALLDRIVGCCDGPREYPGVKAP